MKFGLLLWPQQADWSALVRAAVVADRSGFDSLWTWDHLLSVRGDCDRPIFEGWTTIAALAAVTERATVGLLAGANTLRNPGVTAKMANTLDHISGGRAVLGLGSGWLESEHIAHGIEFGASPGERLDRLAEAVPLVRMLLDGDRVTFEGRFYEMSDAHHLPATVQDRLPILIGGSGPRKTLRIVARHADMWNARGAPEQLAISDEILRRHCDDNDRDHTTIERTCGVSMIIRDDAADALKVLESDLRPFNADVSAMWPLLLGPPDQIAEGLEPFRQLGFDHAILAMPFPFDAETIERIGEVKRSLG